MMSNSWLLLLLLCNGLVPLISSVESLGVPWKTSSSHGKPEIQVSKKIQTDAFSTSKIKQPEIVSSTGSPSRRILQKMERSKSIGKLLDFPRISFYSGLNQTGLLAEFEFNSSYPGKGSCISLIRRQFSEKQLKSIDTFGTCARLFNNFFCAGDSVAVYPGQESFSPWDFALTSIRSIGRCVENEFQFASLSSYSDPAGKVIIIPEKSVESPLLLDVPDFLHVDFDDDYGNTIEPDAVVSQDLVPERNWYGGGVVWVRAVTDNWNKTVMFKASFRKLTHCLEKSPELARCVSESERNDSLLKLLDIMYPRKNSAKKNITLTPLAPFFETRAGDKLGYIVRPDHVPLDWAKDLGSWNQFPISREESYEQWMSALQENYESLENYQYSHMKLAFLYTEEDSRRPYGLYYRLTYTYGYIPL